MEEPEIVSEENNDDSDEVLPIRYSITSYGADYPVDSLVKRMTNGSIYVPKFQRGYVWNIQQASLYDFSQSWFGNLFLAFSLKSTDFSPS